MEYDERTKSASREDFYTAIRKAESGYNAGVCTIYRENKYDTVWTVSGHAVGVSRGKLGTNEDYYLIVVA